MDLDMTVPQDSSPHPAFRIWLCGAFRIERYEKGAYQPLRTSEWGGSSYPRLLLKALLCCPGRQARREALLELLWPESELEQAANYLNTATTKLRKVLQTAKGPESVLITENDATFYRLEGQELLWVDADAALALLKEAEQGGRTRPESLSVLEEAGVLFGAGLFLQEEEGQWVTGRRATIEQARYRARLWLAEAYEQQSMPGQAETVLSALLEEDGLDEDVLCRLMNLLQRQGMTHQALQLYERTGKVFTAEQIELTEATKSLAAQIRLERHHLVRDLPMIEEAPITLRENTSLQGNGEPIPASSLAHMVQFAQTTVHKTIFAEQGGLLPSESRMWLPLALSVQTSSLETTSLDLATWFGARVNDLKAWGIFQHEPAFSFQEHQSLIHTEINTWSKMTDQDQQTSNDYLISRRSALATLATLSATLLKKMQFGPFTTIVAEEFLSQCATSITVCYHLLKGDGLATVEYTLPKYLPLLIRLAKSPSPFQQRAASLTSQGCFLMGLIKLHRLQFNEHVAYCKQGVEFAKIASDRILFITALTHLGNAWFDSGQSRKMLQTYQEAESLLVKDPTVIPPLLKSRIYMGLAIAYARLCLQQDAESNLHLANEAFTMPVENDPLIFSLDYDLSLKILLESFVHFDLGQLEEKNNLSLHSRSQYEQANIALARIEQVPQATIVSERIRIEIVNQRALVAVKSKNIDDFEKYLIAGMQGAKAISSEKRRQEAISNWKTAREQWPHEKRILELADIFM